LTGVELECKAGSLRATTTDGHRLATACLGDSALVSLDWTILVPSAAIDSLLVALRGCVDDSVELSVGKTALLVEGSTFAVQALALDATMPPWRQVCPRENEGTHMAFKGTEENRRLRNAIEQAARAAHASKANVNGIFTFDHSWLTIQIQESDDPSKVLDTVRTEIANRIEGFGITRMLKTSFNLAYWQEALDSIPADAEITIQYGDDVLYPLAIRAGNATHVIMPCRL
jgi:DNA polymerase III sliding clamp (beta) subunit (PCNA family)